MRTHHTSGAGNKNIHVGADLLLQISERNGVQLLTVKTANKACALYFPLRKATEHKMAL
jgi:hypothetical protein